MSNTYMWARESRRCVYCTNEAPGEPDVAPGEPNVAPGEPNGAPGEPNVAPGEPKEAPSHFLQSFQSRSPIGRPSPPISEDALRLVGSRLPIGRPSPPIGEHALRLVGFSHII